jgi:hypothetical protein
MIAIVRQHIEHIVEQKLLEFLGDPDAGRVLKKTFVAELRRRLNSKQKYIPQTTVMRRYGLC